MKTQAPSLDDKPITALLFDVDATLYVSSRLRRAILIRLLRRYWKSPAAGYRAARVISAYRNALETLRTRATSADIESAQIQLTTENTSLTVEEVSGTRLSLLGKNGHRVRLRSRREAGCSRDRRVFRRCGHSPNHGSAQTAPRSCSKSTGIASSRSGTNLIHRGSRGCGRTRGAKCGNQMRNSGQQVFRKGIFHSVPSIPGPGGAALARVFTSCPVARTHTTHYHSRGNALREPAQ